MSPSFLPTAARSASEARAAFGQVNSSLNTVSQAAAIIQCVEETEGIWALGSNVSVDWFPVL